MYEGIESTLSKFTDRTKPGRVRPQQSGELGKEEPDKVQQGQMQSPLHLGKNNHMAEVIEKACYSTKKPSNGKQVLIMIAVRMKKLQTEIISFIPI